MSGSQHLGHFLQRLPPGFRYAYALTPFFFVFRFRSQEKQYFVANGYPSADVAEATPVTSFLGYSVTPVRSPSGALCGYVESPASQKRT